MKFITTLIAAAVLTGCATQPKNIAATDTSPMLYADYTCKQITQESHRIQGKVTTLYNSLKKTADTDSAQMAVGLILFWPTLFFLEYGDGPEAAEYAKLKGQHEALEQAAITKNCPIDPLPEAQEPATTVTVERDDEEDL